MEMRREISIGNMLSILTIFVTASIAWGIMSARVGATEDAVSEVKKDLKQTTQDVQEMKNTISRMDERSKIVEKQLDRQELILKEILQKVK